jgi:AcrR family transcriptional regulator
VPAGLELLAEEGPDALTVGAVAPRAGLGTVYRRFGNKERLLAALQFAFIQIVDADIERHVHRNGRIPTSDAERVQVAIEAPLRWTWRIAWCTPPARIG